MKDCLCRLLLIAMITLALQVRVSALTYQDDFADASQNNIKSYSNLALFPMDGSYYGELPDRSACSFANYSTPIGWATYRVQRAEQIDVGLYTPSGSFLSRNSAEQWVLGISHENTESLAGQSLPQASYSTANRAIYSVAGGSLHKAVLSENGTIFQSTQETPGELIGYGVNVYASANGQSWSRLSLARTALQFRGQAPFVYEQYSATVPSGATYLRVELNDINGLESAEHSGGYIPKLIGTYNCLASVSISGSNLSVGIPETLREESIPLEAQSSYSEPAASSSPAQIRSYQSSSASAAAKVPAADENMRYSGPKFEGVIRSPQSAGRTAGEASPPSNRTSAATSISVQDEFLQGTESPIYQIPANNDDNNYFTAGVTVYIIVVSAALCFIVFASAKRKK